MHNKNNPEMMETGNIVVHLKKRYMGKKIGADNTNYFIEFVKINATDFNTIEVYFRYRFRERRDACDFDDVYAIIQQIRTYYWEGTVFFETTR